MEDVEGEFELEIEDDLLGGSVFEDDLEDEFERDLLGEFENDVDGVSLGVFELLSVLVFVAEFELEGVRVFVLVFVLVRVFVGVRDSDFDEV